MVITEHPPDPTSTTSPPDEAATTGELGRRWWPFIVAAIAVLVGVSLLLPAGRHQWALSFIRQPTHYTTLSFQDAADLPSTIAAGDPVHLSFTVANHEGQRIRYPFVVTSADVGTVHARTVLQRATLSVPDGGQRTASVTVRPVCTSSSCQVQVSLPGHPETIDVLVHVHHPTG